ncbi:MAG TPA: carbonic anhydrase [Ktedonobacterales bacterium]|nr:carbonic anhydrase [Ktedonobacterales bacterium]
MANATFGTAINCIDGRAQDPVAAWVKDHFHVDFVDTITVPGPDGVLTQGTQERITYLRDEVAVSQRAHGSGVVVVAGHFGCAGYPASPEEHQRAIRGAARVAAGWGLPMRVIGLWVNDAWQVEVVCDTANGPL